MKKYTINVLQYHTLSSCLRVKQTDMAKHVGVTQMTISRHLDDGDFKVSDALALCNAYRIPLSFFISTEEVPQIRNVVQTDSAEWKPIRFSAARLLKYIESGVFTYKEISDKTGYVRRTISTIMSGKCRMSQLTHLCNSIRLNMNTLVIDPTLPDIVTGEDIKRENKELKEENKRLRATIERLEKIIEESK